MVCADTIWGKASGGSPQLNSLHFRIQISLGGHTNLQVLQEASWASGRPAGRSQCAPVNPAGPGSACFGI